MVGLLVEEIAELRTRHGFARAKEAVDVEDLLRLRKAEADVAVLKDVNEEIGLKRINGLARIELSARSGTALALLPEAEDDARADDLVVGMRRDTGVEAERRGFQGGFVGLDVFQKFEAKVIEGEFG